MPSLVAGQTNTYLYLDVTHPFLSSKALNYSFQTYYYADTNSSGKVRFWFDSKTGPKKAAEELDTGNTNNQGAWLQLTCVMNNADFGNGLANGADLRIETDPSVNIIFMSAAAKEATNYCSNWPPAHTNYSPYFAANPLSKPTATQGVAYFGSLSTNAFDPDPGDFLTFAKLSGPAWLSIAPDGTMTGTPAKSDTGSNAFAVRVTDSWEATADAVVTLPVLGPTEILNCSYNPLTHLLNLSLMVSQLSIPYHLEVAGTNWLFAPRPGSTFTPTAVPWPVSVEVNPTAVAEFFRVAPGTAGP
jgi:hypothetical protein